MSVQYKCSCLLCRIRDSRWRNIVGASRATQVPCLTVFENVSVTSACSSWRMGRFREHAGNVWASLGEARAEAALFFFPVLLLPMGRKLYFSMGRTQGTVKRGTVISRFFRIFPDFPGFFRKFPDFSGFSRIFPDFPGFVSGFSRVFPDLAGFFRIFPDLAGFFRI